MSNPKSRDTRYPKSTATLTADGLPIGGLVRLPAVLAVVPVSRATWLAWVHNGKAPKPVKIGPRAVAWRVEDVRAFVAALCPAAPDQGALNACAARTARKAEQLI